jgi:hypothetical protein
MKKLKKHFSKVIIEQKPSKNPLDISVLGSLPFFSAQNLVRFDGILDQKRALIIVSSLLKFPIFQEKQIDEFIANINEGNGSEINKDHLDQFISIMPIENEIQEFKDRLEEQGLSSFEELECLKAPRTLKKLDKADWFVIKVLKNEKVMENARTIQNIFEVDQMIESSMAQHKSWMEL